MQLDRVGSTLALHRAHACACLCVCARARAARMFTEYVDPLSSLRHTYALARRSSFTPICLRSPGTIQSRGTGLGPAAPSRCSYISRIQDSEYRLLPRIQIIRSMRKNVYRLFKILNITGWLYEKGIARFSENRQLLQLFYPYNRILFFCKYTCIFLSKMLYSVDVKSHWIPEIDRTSHF